MSEAWEKKYIGVRNRRLGVCAVAVEQLQGRDYALPCRLDLWNHSPDGFNWGYGGSGPAQLALALLADAGCNDEAAVDFHQEFKWQVVAKLPYDGFELPGATVLDWLLDHQAQQQEAQRGED